MILDPVPWGTEEEPFLERWARIASTFTLQLGLVIITISSLASVCHPPEDVGAFLGTSSRRHPSSPPRDNATEPSADFESDWALVRMPSNNCMILTNSRGSLVSPWSERFLDQVAQGSNIWVVIYVATLKKAVAAILHTICIIDPDIRKGCQVVQTALGARAETQARKFGT